MTCDEDFFDVVFPHDCTIILCRPSFYFPLLQIKDDRIIKRLFEEVSTALLEHCCLNYSVISLKKI